jgi:outer membrane protein OmpA-like peptidoglycan-associated protein
MIGKHLIVGIAATGVLGFSGLVGCGHTEVVAAVPAVPVATVVAEPPPPPPPPPPRLTAACDSEIRPQGHVHFPHEVEFDEGKSTIKPSQTSNAILQCLVDFLGNNKMVTKFRVEGYTDNVGDANMNQTLSQQRADSIVAWLTGHGVTTPIWAKGFGPNRPVVPNDTPEHKAMNRRVEFHVDELNGVKATKETIALALNPPAPVAVATTTTAVVGVPTVGVAVPTVGVAVPSVGVAVPTVGVGIAAPRVGVGVAVPTTVGVGVGVGGAPAPATKKEDPKKDKK